MMLYEKYRPTDLAEFIGQDKIKKQIEHIVNRGGWDSDCLWLQGQSGTGKTTLAWIIARRVAKDFYIHELDGSKCTVDAVKDIEKMLWVMAPDSWRVVIVNEAHAMSRQAVQAWLTLLERLQKHTMVIFTTTEIIKDDLFGEFSHALASRCKVLTFTNQGLCQEMAKRAQEIAQAEGLDGKPLPRYVKLVQDCRNNMRQVLQRIDACEMLD